MMVWTNEEECNADPDIQPMYDLWTNVCVAELDMENVQTWPMSAEWKATTEVVPGVTQDQWVLHVPAEEAMREHFDFQPLPQPRRKITPPQLQAMEDHERLQVWAIDDDAVVAEPMLVD